MYERACHLVSTMRRTRGRPGGSRHWRLVAGILVLGSWGCRPRAVVSKPVSDEAPPYQLVDVSSDLRSVAYAADGQHAWAVGHHGTILRSADGGRTWEGVPRVPVKVELSSIAFSSDGKNGWVVGRFGNILRTTDGGQTWARLENVPSQIFLQSVSFAQNGLAGWVAGRYGTILRTTDGGQTWTKVPTATDASYLHSVAFAADGLLGVAVGDDGNVWRSTDGGAGWHRVEGISVEAYLQSVTLSADGTHGWAVGDYGVVLRSDDGGKSWEREGGVPTQAYLNRITFAADSLHGWIAGDNGTVLLSGDGGRIWRKSTLVPTEEDLYGLALSPDGVHGLAVGGKHTILGTADAGLTWQKIEGSPSDAVLRSVAFAADARHGLAVGADGSILGSSDGGSDWKQLALAPGGKPLTSVVIAADGLRAWAVGMGGTILRSEAAGQTWDPVKAPSQEDLESVSFADDGERGWIAGAHGTLLRTADGGSTWKEAAGAPTDEFLDGVAFAADGEHGWAVGAHGTILRTADGGRTWQKVPGISTEIQLTGVAFGAEGKGGVAVGTSGSILRTVDGGQSWTRILGDLNGFTIASVALAADGRRGWAVGTGGFAARTIDGGLFWWIVSAFDKSEAALDSVRFTPDGEHGWIVGAGGTMLRTSDSVSDRRLLNIGVSHELRANGGILQPVLQVERNGSPAAPLKVMIRLSGPRAAGDLEVGFRRYFTYGQPFSGWKEDDLGPGVYTCHAEFFDGWNVVTYQFSFGSGRWPRFAQYMGWNVASFEIASFAKNYGPQNLALLACLYGLTVLVLFLFFPYSFVLWHEKLAGHIAAIIPGKATDKISKLAGLFLIGRTRTLDAVVRRHAPAALVQMSSLADVRTRPKWVAAPLEVDDEEFGTDAHPFGNAADADPRPVYIRGLSELSRHLSGGRWWISIEGPGGVGKSALAFQIARWFADPQPESRCRLPQAIPISIRNLRDGLDKEVLAELRRILELPRLSTQLAEALIRKRRVLALVDGVSEKVSDLDALFAEQMNPSKGGEMTHLLVVTSRRRILAPEVLKVLPKPVDLGSIDTVISRYLDDIVGAGRFGPAQREAIREALKGVMKEISDAAGKAPEVPMVFLKLIIERADQTFGKDGDSGAPVSLPADIPSLVDAYLANLFEARTDVVGEERRARRAALACVGQNGIPKWRPLAAYEARELKQEEVESLVVSGLISKDATDAGDPLYKFALDPIAEYLAAKETVMAVRDSRMTAAAARAACAQFEPASEVVALVDRIARAMGVKLD
jgi:photosystem II stability/assembly factor-like uncharacterized protein